MKLYYRHIAFVLFQMLLCVGSYGQVTQLSQATINTTSNDRAATGGIIYNYSIGEPVITTVTGNTSPGPVSVFTQGFQQPFKADSSGTGILRVVISTVEINCSENNSGYAVAGASGGVSPYTYSWSGAVSGSKNDTAYFNRKGTYSFLLTDAAGDTLSVKVLIKDGSYDCLHFYKGFSPNGDGVNDAWEIKNIELFTVNKISIFNLWGSLVWQADAYDNKNTVWKGNNTSGDPLPPATYFYIGEINGNVYKGWVELIK